MGQELLKKERSRIVRDIFSEMASEYDDLSDLWYQYTFSSIDEVILHELRPSSDISGKPIALDVGCGTGTQSLRLASLGYRVLGVDIADRLLVRARRKLAEADYADADFMIADAQSLPLDDNVAHCVNCCGPTLSFIPDWRDTLTEVSRCLKPGGKLLLEVEGKWNLDLFWEIANALGFNFLGYDESLLTALSHLLPPWRLGHTIDYSFKSSSDASVSMPLRLFTAVELGEELQSRGLAEEKRWGLHVTTNLIPSTILHKANPSRPLTIIFRALARLEKKVNGRWPPNALGCSLLVLARKNQHCPDSTEGGNRPSSKSSQLMIARNSHMSVKKAEQLLV